MNQVQAGNPQSQQAQNGQNAVVTAANQPAQLSQEDMAKILKDIDEKFQRIVGNANPTANTSSNKWTFLVLFILIALFVAALAFYYFKYYKKGDTQDADAPDTVRNKPVKKMKTPEVKGSSHGKLLIAKTETPVITAE